MLLESRAAQLLWSATSLGLIVAFLQLTLDTFFDYGPDWLIAVGAAGLAVSLVSFAALSVLWVRARLRGRDSL